MPIPVIGSTVPIAVLVTGVDGVTPTNAATNTLTITQPDGSVVTPTATNPSTGNYVEYFVTTQAGRHNWYWVTTGPVSSTSGAFDVEAANPGRLVSVSDFMLYLNNPGLDQTRAAFILDMAQILCESIVAPLPVGAETVVLDVAERAFSNPTVVGNSGLGLYSEGAGAFSTDRPGVSGGGLWLTENNEATLRRLNGGGGAFSIDTLAADYTPSLPPWDLSTQYTNDFGF